MNQKELKDFIERLSALGERQFGQEAKARGLIEASLKSAGIAYERERFKTYLPRFREAKLIVDGKQIPCAGTSLVSGVIDNANHLISSLTSSQNFLYTDNINFNPVCPGISRSNHYFAPSLAIPKKYVPVLCNAKKVFGSVKVIKEAHTSANILVGNMKDPDYLVFSHYDSISTGAIDNASGTALSLYLAIQHPKLLEKTLFIFCGNEELSYDKGIYWGHGYRVFEKKHYPLLLRAKKILVVDCVGYSETNFIQDSSIVVLGFPITAMQKFAKKTYLVIGDMQKLMTVYHSSLDTPDFIKMSHMMEAAGKLVKALS